MEETSGMLDNTPTIAWPIPPLPPISATDVIAVISTVFLYCNLASAHPEIALLRTTPARPISGWALATALLCQNDINRFII